MILILSPETDEHANEAARLLSRHGAKFQRFDAAQFPGRSCVCVSYADRAGFRYRLRSEQTTLDLESVSAVWLRRPGRPVAAPSITDRTVATYVAAESGAFIEDVWQTLDARWLPGRLADVRLAEKKIVQLTAAREVGFQLPATLLSNDPDDLLEFGQQHNWDVVTKLPSAAFARTFHPTFQRFTERLSPRDIGYLDAVQLCPLIFQAYVPKHLEIRATVVGDRVFAAEIHSQRSRHTRTDWRRYDFFATSYAAHELPPAMIDACVRLTQRLGLCYGAIDLVLMPDGGYVFLEINPAGQYLWIERSTGLPITQAICNLLMGRAHQELVA